MVLEVLLTEQEFQTALRDAAKPSPRTLAIVGALFIVAALVAWLVWENPIVVISILIGGSGGAWIGQIIQINYIGSRVFRQLNARHRSYNVSWDDEAVAVRSADSMASLRWSDMHKAREVDGLFVLFLSDANFLVIPARTFPNTETLTDFRRLMRARAARSS